MASEGDRELVSEGAGAAGELCPAVQVEKVPQREGMDRLFELLLTDLLHTERELSMGFGNAEVTGDFGRSHFFGVDGEKPDEREFWCGVLAEEL